MWITRVPRRSPRTARVASQRSRHIERRYLKVREWGAHGDIRCVYVPTDQNPTGLLTKSLEVAAFDRHRLALSGATAAAAANATHAGDSIGTDVALEPLGVWEAYFAA
eukprot:6701374-Prymnesium_polylepis.1